MEKEGQFNKTDWRNASGAPEYTLTNDYMFRMVLQRCTYALKGLISSMMHIPKEEIESVVIENPIELGKRIDAKDFVLDIKIMLNNSEIINMEMQVANLNNWENRSLSYLCRTFDNVQKGEDYNSVIGVTHIGFLDYDLDRKYNEFYSEYVLMNKNNYEIYNSKFSLRVLSLNQIDKATDEDKKWLIDEWARIFKARTWEELKMLAEKNKEYEEVADVMYELNSDETVRMMCEARREAIFHEEYTQKRMKELEEARKEAEFHEEYMQKQMKELEEAKQKSDQHQEQMQKQMKELEEAKQKSDERTEELLKRLEELEAKLAKLEENN